MDRMRGLDSFLVIAAIVLAGVRAVHVAVPLFVPNARPGPFAPARLDDVARYSGFAPIVPAYRPASLGERPASLTVWLIPYPTFAANWSGDHVLSLVQQLGGPMPSHAPTSQPLEGFEGSAWWQDSARAHLVLRRGEFWITIETDLNVQELRRFVDTLTQY